MENPEFELSGTALKKYKGKGGVVRVPDGVTAIAYQSIFWRSDITEIILPCSVRSIDTEGIVGCDHLKKINLPSGITALGGNALRYAAIEELEIPDTVTHMGYAALGGCKNLKALTLPKGINVVEARLLAECRSLGEVQIPEGVTRICRGAFTGTALESVVIPDKVESIASGAFEYCTQLTLIEIPASVSYIGNSVFRDCPVTVRTTAGSYAETYAAEHGIPVVHI